MATKRNYDVKDLKLAAKGKLRVDWAAKDMPVLGQIAGRTEAFAAGERP